MLQANENDYISLTDMLKAKDGDFFISDWLRNRNTLEYLSAWETMNNPNFNYGEFATIKDKSGLNNFKITGLVQFTHGTTGDIILYAPTDRHVLNRCIEEAKKFGAPTLLSFRLTYDNLTLTYTATGIAARPSSPSK